MKRIAVCVMQAVGILAAGLILGTLLLMAAYVLPTSSVEKNVAASAEVFEREGDHPILFEWTGTWLDNWTDALMLLNARYSGEESSLEKAMLVPRRQSMYLDSMSTLTGESKGEIKESDYFVASYSRYWHGYLIFLKPLLMLTDYSGIRVLNLILQTMLTISVLAVMWKKKFHHCIAPYIVNVLSLMPIDNALSMQYADVTYLFSLGILFMLLYNDRWMGKRNVYMCYFICMGILTAYFDFLTYPIVSFGVPMVIWLCINFSGELQRLKKVIQYGIGWGYGYFGMWGGKWILATLITGGNVLQEARDSALYRIYGGGDVPASGISLIWETLVLNVGAYIHGLNGILLPVFTAAAFILLTKRKAWRRWMKLVPAFGLMATVPFVWYAVIRSHSYVHYWMTYKDLGVTCIAFTGLCACALAERQAE